MISNWKLFNEKSSNNNLTFELLEDYFLTIEDMGYNVTIEFGICTDHGAGTGDNDWMALDDCSSGIVSKSGFLITFDNRMYEIKDVPNLWKFSKMISELNNICKRIENNYNCTTHIEVSDYSIKTMFETPGSLYDACYISYSFLKDYLDYFFKMMPQYISHNSKFTSKGKNCFIEFEIDENKLKQHDGYPLSAKEFKDIFNQFIESDYGRVKFDSIKKVGNKYIIKNFVSTEDIQFNY